ncbi:ATP-binding protein [Streptomyces sp. NPDC005423]|uniref:ATP-binding protein n=1 Tax=Streptomyces sp. NPDC005423 TaxID=3155343 RepID=UPI0033B1CA95
MSWYVARSRARSAASEVERRTEERAAQVTEQRQLRLADAIHAAQKAALGATEELRRGGSVAVQRDPSPRPGDPMSSLEWQLAQLKVQIVNALISVHTDSQPAVLLDVLRCLAQREHALVERALAGLSELEGQTDDPELLDRTFRIDHLVTRVRRHIESMAVLGGQSLRATSSEASLSAVIRGSVAEVVDYARVEAAPGEVGFRFGFAKHAGPELSHLLAELIENGLVFSPPDTKVQVRAQEVPKGLAIEVVDRALRIEPSVRARLNQLLAEPDTVDVGAQVRAGQIGLLTAAKIAQRHGLSVELVENSMGGTTALVVVPGRLLVPIDVDGPEVRDAPPVQPARLQRPATSPAFQGRSAPSSASVAAERADGGPPRLPRRNPERGWDRIASQERPQGSAAVASPDLAAAFRSGFDLDAEQTCSSGQSPISS